MKTDSYLGRGVPNKRSICFTRPMTHTQTKAVKSAERLSKEKKKKKKSLSAGNSEFCNGESASSNRRSLTSKAEITSATEWGLRYSTSRAWPRREKRKKGKKKKTQAAKLINNKLEAREAETSFIENFSLLPKEKQQISLIQPQFAKQWSSEGWTPNMLITLFSFSWNQFLEISFHIFKIWDGLFFGLCS